MPLNVLHYRHEGRTAMGRGPPTGRSRRFPASSRRRGAFLEANSIDALSQLERRRSRKPTSNFCRRSRANQQFLCQGANYRQHMIESGMNPDAKTFNMIFTKAASCIAPPNTHVVKPTRVRFLDYEIELGLVLKRDVTGPATRHRRRTCPSSSPAPSSSTTIRRATCRSRRCSSTRARAFAPSARSAPTSACSCRTTSYGSANLQLSLTVNGKVRQKDSVANLVYGPVETLTELSGVQDLNVGDLLSTGTPSGCALSIPSPARQRIAALLPEAAKWKMFMTIQAGREQYLKDGDVVESRIATPDGAIDLGVQRNGIVDAR